MDNLATTVSKAKETLSSQADRFLMRTMADSIKDYLSEYCDGHPEFAEKVSDPAKNFTGCIKRINREALKWLQEQPNTDMEGLAGVCGDVPNDICYGWAVDYYNSVPEPKPKPNSAGKKAAIATRKQTPAESQSGEFADDGIERAGAPGSHGKAAEQMSLLGI